MKALMERQPLEMVRRFLNALIRRQNRVIPGKSGVVAFFVVVASIHAPVLAGDGNLEKLAPETTRAEINCPSQNFAQFFRTFSSDVAVQRGFTHYPLKTSKAVNVRPAPRQVEKMLSESEVKFPIVPNAHDRKQLKLTYKVRKLGEQRIDVILEKPDTDYLLIYKFTKQDCWKLMAFESYSL